MLLLWAAAAAMPPRRRGRADADFINDDPGASGSDGAEGTQDVRATPRAYQAEGKSFADLSPEDQDKLVGRIVRRLLVRNVSRVPIKREELSKALGTDIPRKRKLLQEVIDASRRVLRAELGMDLVEVNRRVAHRGGGAGGGGGATQSAATAAAMGAPAKAYVVISSLAPELRPEPRADEKAVLAFTTVLASMILLEPGARLSEDRCFDFFVKMGLGTAGAPAGAPVVHPQLGDVRALVGKTLPSQGYLDREKEGDGWVLTLGPRLRVELADSDLLTFVEGVFGEALDAANRKELELRLSAMELGEA